MENTINVFTDGIITDSHPLTTQNNLLTEALNATFRTYNGNELALQNDMGNTLILDSVTGNIMGLREGFIPIGMKEHGGILYIASTNIKTGEGELGTIPSPLITYNYDKTPYVISDPLILTNINHALDSMYYFTDFVKYLNSPFKLSDNRFCVGDLFIITLNLNTNNALGIKRNIIPLNPKALTLQEIEMTYNIITGFNNMLKEYGMLNLQLKAKVENSDSTITIKGICDTPQLYYIESDPDIQNSKYWFINTNTTLDLDTERCEADNCYRTYPNILPGFLYGLLLAELPENFELFTNSYTQLKSPITYIITD